MSSIIVARSASELEQLRNTWERLSSSGNYTFFQDFAWNLLAARFFAAREKPYVVCAETPGGAAIIPGAVRPDGAGLLGETLFDYRNVLAEGDGEALELAWSKLGELGLPLDVIAIRTGAARERWAGMDAELFCQAPAVSPDDISPEGFRARHTGIGRHWRRLQRAGTRLCRYDGSEVDRVRRVLDQKAGYPEPDNLLRDPLRREFLCAAATLHTSQTDVFTIEVGGEMAAGLLTFRDGATRRFYTITYDRRWASYSPGNALLFEVVRQSLAEGLLCDFMTGEQPYKLRFATRNVPLYRLHLPAAALAAPWTAARAA